MAKSSQRARTDISRTEASPAADASDIGADAATQIGLVVFRLGDTLFGLRLGAVSEIVRPPALAYMPLAPRSILGLANFRGNVLPVISLRRLVGLPDITFDAANRVLVVEQDTPAGFAVDRVDSLLTISTQQIENAKAGAGGIDPELLEGVVKRAEGQSPIGILNPARLLRGQFVEAAKAPLGAAGVVSDTTSRAAAAPQARKKSFISFDIGAQEYALPLDDVREIIPLPDHVSSVAHSETAVLGVTTLRDRLLPIISLRMLLGLSEDTSDERGKVLVLSVGRATVGVVTDRTREILHVDPDLIDTAPTLLTRGTGDAEVTEICRLERGKRLVAILSPERLFRSELVSRILSEQDTQATELTEQTDGGTMTDRQFIIFRLGGQEYGLPIGAVDEVARPPEKIAKLPRAPSFIDGVMNLRGHVVPIVDLRRRFSLVEAGTAASHRVLVLSVAGAKTGFMVDAVSEVMKIADSTIKPSPQLSSEQVKLIGHVANLEAQDRMVLLIDPAQLLSQVETDVLLQFERTSAQQTAPVS
jgi:purine-binding chemotaxis protein CheW